MPSELHDRLWEALIAAFPRLTQLLTLQDDRLGFQDDRRISLFLPDFHLMSEQAQARFPNYRFNHETEMVQLVRTLEDFTGTLGPDEELHVHHLGDFFDLWRETPPEGDHDPTAIIRTHREVFRSLARHLYWGVGNPRLKVYFLRGNHDFALPYFGDFTQWARWRYLPNPDGATPALVLHGDVFDWVEKLPDDLQNFFVYLFPHSAGTNQLGTPEETEEAIVGLANQERRMVRAFDDPVETRPLSILGSPPRFADPNDQEARQAHDFLPSAYRAVRDLRREFGVQIRLVVIGHTHKARMAIYDGDGEEFLVLMDCGAWIENYTVPGDDTVRSNAQFGVLVGNECRLYQLDHGA
ncbi:MAG: metallophosphoesterase [Candidatus Methylomirabilales bacterium]